MRILRKIAHMYFWAGFGSLAFADGSLACPVIYKAVITESDLTNSSGTNLDTLGGLIRQDRANYHKYSRRDPGDESDPILYEEKKRAALEAAVNRSDSNYDFVDPFYWDADPGTEVTVTFWYCESPPRAFVKLPDPPTPEENEEAERLHNSMSERNAPSTLDTLPPPPP